MDLHEDHINHPERRITEDKPYDAQEMPTNIYLPNDVVLSNDDYEQDSVSNWKLYQFPITNIKPTARHYIFNERDYSWGFYVELRW